MNLFPSTEEMCGALNQTFRLYVKSYISRMMVIASDCRQAAIVRFLVDCLHEFAVNFILLRSDLVRFKS